MSTVKIPYDRMNIKVFEKGIQIFGQILSRHLTLEEVMSDITDVQNSLNINFTGIDAFEYLFSVKLYEK